MRSPSQLALVLGGLAAGCARTAPAPGATSAPPTAASAAAVPTVPAAPAVPPLEGTRWVLVRVGDQRVITPTADPERVPHLVFDAASGRASGSGGCNRLRGPYALRGAALSVGPVVGTRMACPDVMATEHAFTGALERVRAWRVVDGRLELLDADGPAGQVVAAFTAAPR